MRRVLRPGGRQAVVIPCEGGLAYSLGRRVTVQREFRRRYGNSYEPLVQAEHIDVPREILPELTSRFDLLDRTYWPLRVPSVTANLLLGITVELPPNR